MKTISLSKIINFIILLLFSIGFSILIFLSLKIPRILSFVLGFLLGGSLSILFGIVFEKLNEKNALRLKTAKRIKQCMLILNTLASDEILEIFLTAFNNLNISATIINEHTLRINNKIAIILFPMSPLTLNEIYFLSLKHKKDKILIISPEFEKGVSAKVKPNVTLIDKTLIYAILEKANALPDLNKTTKRPFLESLNAFFNVIFTKPKGLKFIFYGIVLFLFSFVTFFPTYYIISGVFFIVYGLIALFFGKFETKKSLDEFLHETLEN